MLKTGYSNHHAKHGGNGASYTPDFMNLPEKINSMKKKDDYDQVSIGLINSMFSFMYKG